MRLISFIYVALMLLPGHLLAQGTPTDRLADATTQERVTQAVKQLLRDDTNYNTDVRPEMFEVLFSRAECLEFHDETAEATVGTCLLTARGWQLYAVFAVTFPYDLDGAFGLHPLTIIIE